MENKEHSLELQQLYLELLISDPESFVRVQNIFNHENFDRGLQAPAKFLSEYVMEYSKMPEISVVNTAAKSDLQKLDNIDDSHYEWLLDEFEQFSKQREIGRAILDSADLLEQGDFDQIENLIKTAVQTSLTRDLGVDYWHDPKARILQLKENNGQIKTGWESVDAKLFGGINRGELNIFAGGSGSGKSLFMQNLAVNWVLEGLNVVYITLELSQGLTAIRVDSMVSGIHTKQIFKDLDNLSMLVSIKGKQAGNLQIKYFPAQSTINDFRSFLKELQIQTGNKADIILIDYLDLCSPVSVKVSASDTFIKDKYVCEELRNLAVEMNTAMVTASQLNRSSVDEMEFDHSHIAGGISKINTADNVFGIFTSTHMRESGRYQLQFMKTRSSSGIGSKIDLEFNIETLRITDPGLEAQNKGPTKSDLMSKIKRNTISSDGTVEPVDDEFMPRIKIDATSSPGQMRNMINDLKNRNSNDI